MTRILNSLSCWADELKWIAILFCFTTIVWTTALSFPRPEATTAFFATIGVIALWRYSWWLCHQVRAGIYLRRIFPQLRKAVSRPHADLDRLYVVVLSYNIPEEAFIRCYAALIDAATQGGVPTTIVASITSDKDRRLLNQVYFSSDSPENIEIVAQFQDGNGKRAAIAEGLRVVARDLPPARSVTVLMDGDTILSRDAIAKSIVFFQADPDLAAATTNNRALVQGTYTTKNWYAVRMAQRHTLMASMALSHRLLVLTGRYSLFRTDLAVSADFIAQVEHDTIAHWRLGDITLLTGDDKSTWFNILKRGGKMLYIPDVVSYSVEALPSPGRFFPASTRLMRRWFGNMLRANNRSVALGPRKTGAFIWWSLVDQKLSVWTSLVGPVAVVFLTAFLSPIFIVYYLAWALFIRSVLSIGAALNHGTISASWPFLMYYNQVWGAVLKSWLIFHLDRQSWTRQDIAGAAPKGIMANTNSTLLHILSLLLLTACVGVFIGQI